MFSFDDKVVVITGAARGLGRVTALGFGRAGAKVVVSDIEDGGCKETLQLLHASGGEGLCLHADVRSEAEVEAVFARSVEAYGRLDCVVNNAGTEIVGELADQTEEHCDVLMDTNVKGVFFCLKHALRQMAKNGGGAIVNQASVTSSLTGVPGNGLCGGHQGCGDRAHQDSCTRGREAQRERECDRRLRRGRAGRHDLAVDRRDRHEAETD
jgi:NAD(P)-dependent dehydrogenase (short-subunit alcohol dehydrogenase family)